MNEIRDATRLLFRLAGQLGFSNRECPGFSIDDQVDLYRRLAEAREDARLNVREFLGLNHQPLAEFCAKYGLTRREVRFGQAIVDRVWAEWRSIKRLQRLLRERNRRSIQ